MDEPPLGHVCTHMMIEYSSKGAVLVHEAVSTVQTCCMTLKLGMWTRHCTVQYDGVKKAGKPVFSCCLDDDP